EGRSIVGAHQFRHAIFPKRCNEPRLDRFSSREPSHRLAPQQVPAVAVANGQRVTTLSISGTKMALEICTPYLIGLLTMYQRPFRGYRSPTSPDFSAQAPARQHITHSALRGTRWQIQQLGVDFGRSPQRLFGLPFKNALFHLPGYRMGLVMRRSGQFLQPSSSALPETVEPFMHGFATDSILESHFTHRHFVLKVLFD